MNRSKKLAVLSHCILNQNAVVKGEYKDMNVFFSFVQELFGNNIGILQLPCPETECYGLKRWGHVKEQFNNSGYKKYARETLNSFINTLREYIDNGYEIVGIYLLLIRLGTIIIVAFFKLKKRYILRNIKACGII